jgi:hypothetical protein
MPPTRPVPNNHIEPNIKFQMPPTRPVPNNHIEPNIKFKETIPLRTWWG